MADETEVAALRERLAALEAEKEEWLEEKAELIKENEVLRSRCQKLARAAAQPEPSRTENSTQTEDEEHDGKAGDAEGGRQLLPPMVDQMLRSPKDAAVQLQGIEALFAQQTQVDASQTSASAAVLQASLEAAVAIFANHSGNHMLLLKASQFLSVLLAEAQAQQQLPMSVLFQAAQAVSAVGIQLLADVASQPAEALAAQPKAGVPAPSKLLTWFLSLLALLLPALGSRLRERGPSEAFVRDLLTNLVARLLSCAALPQEALVLKCVQLVPLLPMEPWIQKACLESGALHAMAFPYQRSAGAADAPLPKAILLAVRGAFSDNLELCVKAVDDQFVSDEFICLEVLDHLKGMEKRHRGTFRALDSDWGICGKLLNLWAFHQRRALEDPDPSKSGAKLVLQKVAELLSAVMLKLPPHSLLQRMQEFQGAEVLHRIALSGIHSNAQLRLQVAVNYAENDVIPVIIGCMQMLLQHYEGTAPPPTDAATSVEAAFALLNDQQLPAEGWPYVQYCLEVCIHVLSHWSATKLSLQQKADVIDTRAAPMLLAQSGLVDVLAELVDPAAAGFELHQRPPPAVLQKASETLQALFEQSGHICLFCMQHYTEVKQMVSLGCESLSMDPLNEFPEMQQQAVDQLVASFERFSARDERLGRKILKALAVLFESSYRLVNWFLQNKPLSSLGEYSSTDVHAVAVRAVARAPYWSGEDAPLLPEFVACIAQLLLGSIEGLGPDSSAASASHRVLDLTEAEEVVAACMTSVLHLLLIDPTPPTVLHCLARSLGQVGKAEADDADQADEGMPPGVSEKAVGAIWRVMEVFPSSDRVQMDGQYLLTSLIE